MIYATRQLATLSIGLPAIRGMKADAKMVLSEAIEHAMKKAVEPPVSSP